MSRADKSHVPLVGGQKHPYHAVAMSLVKAGGSLAEIKSRVQAMQAKLTPSLVDYAFLKEKLKASGDLDKLKDHIRAAMKKIPGPQPEACPMPKPPPASTLYGRVLKDNDVVDVGSGDGRRLIQYAGQFGVTTVDSKVEKTRLDTPHVHGEYKAQDKPITHFMSMTNNKDQGEYIDSDGVGIVPNLPQLVKHGFTKEVAPGVFESTDGARWYRDYNLEVPPIGLTQFYSGVNTYRLREFELHCDPRKIGQIREALSIGRRVQQLSAVPKDCSVKYAGYQWRYRKKKGKAAFITRSGEVYKARGGGPDMDFDFEMTWGGPRLIRVNLYRGVAPFHSLAALHYFTSRVKIKIEGQPLLAPEEFDWTEQMLERVDVEGLVYREKGVDFLLRKHQSFDILARKLPDLAAAVEDAGLKVIGWNAAVAEPDERIEVEVRLENDTAKLVCVAKRDKHRLDDIGKVEEKLSWPSAYDLLDLQRGTDKYDPFLMHVEDVGDEPETDDE